MKKKEKSRMQKYVAISLIASSFFLLLLLLTFNMNATWTQGMPDPSPQDENNLTDDFANGPYLLNEGQTSPDGRWLAVYNGHGVQGVRMGTDDTPEFFQRPQTHEGDSEIVNSSVEEDTNAALAVSTAKWSNLEGSINFGTVRQLREDGPPNPWEVAWVFPKYVDDTHHYFFNLSSDGWEFGKKDNLPGDSTIERQIYLQTSESPVLEIGKIYRLDWKIEGAYITLWLDGNKIVDLTDDGSTGVVDEETTSAFKVANGQTNVLSSPGSVGLYSEDAEAMFRRIEVMSGTKGS